MWLRIAVVAYIVIVALLWVHSGQARRRVERMGDVFDAILATRSRRVLAVIGLWFGMYILWIVVERPTVASPVVFVKQESVYTFLWGLLLGLVEIIANRERPSEEWSRLRRKQKQRILVLQRFEPSNVMNKLLGEESIYNAMVGALQRAEQHSATLPWGRIGAHVRLLLCSPAVDYPGRGSYETWGEEFSSRIQPLAANQRVDLRLVHLAERSIAGFRPLDGFLEVLASYCAAKEGSGSAHDARTIYRDLKKASMATIETCRKQMEYHPERVRVETRPNVPFQIVLTGCGEFKEVVVAFAGREILEDGRLGDPQGFHSTDAFVVETFAKVFGDYVTEFRRTPLAPSHSLKVIARHKSAAAHRVKNFLGLGIDIDVAPGVFSPAHANSSKFTADALTKILQKGQTVIDIGAGTGILSLVATRILERRGGAGRIVAVEPDAQSFACLASNLRNNGLADRIEVLQAELVAVISDGSLCSPHDLQAEDAIARRALIRCNGWIERGPFDVAKECRLEPADVIIADLPFVNARAEEETERGFFDLEHRNHDALLGAIIENGWLKAGGVVVTAFSSLGGPEDVAKFESLVERAGFWPTQKFTYFEDGYAWFVYVLMKERPIPNYWWKRLSAEASKQ